MPTIKRFTHACDELITKPINNYAVVYDNVPRRSECFNNALIDEQVILCSNNEKIDEAYIAATINGCDSPYPDTIVYFFPTEHVSKVKTIINKMVNQWLAREGSGIYYSENGDIYIALRHTANGLWVMTYDATTIVAFEKAHDMFNDEFTIVDSHRNKKLDLTQPFVAYNVEESSGECFFHHFKKVKHVFALMKQEGLFDEDCGKRKKSQK